jgi:DMSO/TMAO reductase YedYZ molybdopterin-dependent catalytic subunit
VITRRSFLETASLGTMLVGPALLKGLTTKAEARAELGLSQMLPSGTRSGAVLDALAGKKPLIKLSYSPPNYETPVEYFRSTITPNDAFFVRYHLSNIPKLDADGWKLEVGGNGAERALTLDLEELRRLPAFEVVAVCQSAGIRRGLFHPHVPGIEWGHGAMGCSRWRGARLRDLLDKVGMKKEVLEIVFDGADSPHARETPNFVKSIPIWKALEDTTLLAYEMNGEPLPHWHGFPVRLVVPGWAGTYWVKHLTSISIETKPFEGFWMKSAYRIPKHKFATELHFGSQETNLDAPITEILVNSLITAPRDGTRFSVGVPVTITGLAWDGGFGIQTVEVSIDGGKTWTAAQLEEDAGRFAFRSWQHVFTPRQRGKHVIMARATNWLFQSQPTEPILNPEGFHHSAIQTSTVIVA